MNKTMPSKGMMKPTIVVLVTIAVLGAGYAWYARPTTPVPTEPVQTPTGKYMGIEAYVTNYISDLSPVKEQVGGTFYVTELKITSPTAGVVSYEDGHNAYVADFTYQTDPETYRPEVTSFIVRL